MVFFFDCRKIPVREYLKLMIQLRLCSNIDKGCNFICLGKTEVPTYLQSYSSAFVSNINNFVVVHSLASFLFCKALTASLYESSYCLLMHSIILRKGEDACNG